MPVQIAFSRASLIFQKRFPDAVNTKRRPYVASTGCTRSQIATTKLKIIITKIRKNCPLKSSYVAPREYIHFFSLDAGHDGDGNSCPDNTGYIMEASSGVSSDVTSNLRLWGFSTCSIDYYTAFINQLNS